MCVFQSPIVRVPSAADRRLTYTYTRAAANTSAMNLRRILFLLLVGTVTRGYAAKRGSRRSSKVDSTTTTTTTTTTAAPRSTKRTTTLTTPLETEAYTTDFTYGSTADYNGGDDRRTDSRARQRNSRADSNSKMENRRPAAAADIFANGVDGLRNEKEILQLLSHLATSVQHMSAKMTAMENQVKSISKQSLIAELSDNLIHGLGVQMCLQPNVTGYPHDCFDVGRFHASPRSGIYKIKPMLSDTAFDVYCDLDADGGGWTVFQVRMDGSVDFFRGWDAYRNGFGRLNGEFWLGNDKISQLTQSKRMELRIDMEDAEGNSRYAGYDQFAVASEDALYRLSLGAYYGTAGDSLTRHRNMAWTTKDNDHDLYSGNCAVTCHGAWWYENCHDSNLNGVFLLGPHKSFADGINWRAWKDYYYSLRRSVMKVRPVGYVNPN
ncbi:PREDICTED: techylectin-5B-like [Priapulus caudatus]|uniref:Techylectin-5B-like n=1 Tax=Priapulus caudatus TaxID=37621 RepID=A0ABM1EAY1_PRICU|nr:PREDICTED: techylectin-5B-like [Priapulus caudatus]